MTKQANKKYRIRNWPEYNRALVNRGSLTIWLSEDALSKWHAASSSMRGRPRVYSDEAILCALMIKAVYKLPFRALRGLLLSIELFRNSLSATCKDMSGGSGEHFVSLSEP